MSVQSSIWLRSPSHLPHKARTRDQRIFGTRMIEAPATAESLSRRSRSGPD
jgi:hypothetical protein